MLELSESPEGVLLSGFFTIFTVCSIILKYTYYITMEANKKSKIGANMKKYRAKSGISQDRLSKMADVTYHTIIKIESGVNKNPTIETLGNIAKALGVGVDDLIQ